MKLKQLVRVMLVGCSILAISACSTTGKNGGGQTGYSDGDASGAQAAGMGEGDGFGGTGGSGSRHAANGRTYYFNYDKSEVRDEDKPAIMANAEKLVNNPSAKVIVEGHTDPRGSREYNVALGERRANAVADLMKTKGVGSNQARVVSYGAERLAATGHTEEDFQLDRRAVIADSHG